MLYRIIARILPLCIASAALIGASAVFAAPDFSADANRDYVLYWLPYGVKGKSPAKTRVFNIQTPNYLVDFDIDNMTFTRFSALPNIPRSAAPDAQSDALFASAPSASMQMTVVSDGKEYILSGWKNSEARPLLYDGGKFCYQIEVENLAFRAADGSLLPGKGKMVVFAWSDKVFFTVSFTPTADLNVDYSKLNLSFGGQYSRFFGSNGLEQISQKLGKKPISHNRSLDVSSFYSKSGAGTAVVFSSPVDYETHEITSNSSGVQQQSVIYDKSRHDGKPKVWLGGEAKLISFALLGTVKDHVKTCLADVDNERQNADVQILSSTSGETYCYKGYKPRSGFYLIENPATTPKGSLHRVDVNHTEKVTFRLANNSKSPKRVRLMMSQEIKGGIEGPYSVLVDKDGYPAGLDVQISKDWHGIVWHHTYTVLNLKPGQSQDQSILVGFQNWGKKPSVCHGQLSLVGYDSAMDTWKGMAINCQAWYEMSQGLGESVCYDPTSVHCGNVICDIRPNFYPEKTGSWWGTNVGGGDFLACYDKSDRKQIMTQPKIFHDKQQPCLADIDHVLVTPDGAARQSVRTRSFSSNDMVRTIYNIRVDISKNIQFNGFSIFTLAAPNYNACQPSKLTWGTVDGAKGEITMDYSTKGYQTPGITVDKPNTWLALYKDPAPAGDATVDGGANRGLIVRSYKAKIHGKPSSVASLDLRRLKGSLHPIAMIVEVNPSGADGSLQAGDYIEAEVEMVIYHKAPSAYIGPDQTMKNLIETYGDSWQIPYWEAKHNNIGVNAKAGKALGSYPVIVALDSKARAEFELTGGMGLVPIELRGFKDYKDIAIQQFTDGKWVTLDQSVNGKDFWQAQYDPTTGTYTGIFNVQISPVDETPCKTRFRVGKW